MKTARVHHAARRRGGVAARGARAQQPGKLPTIGFLGAATPSAGAIGPPLLCSVCANSAGSRAATSRSSIAGRRDATSASPRSRPNSSGSRSTSSSQGTAMFSRQSRRHRSSRSCSRWWLTRSASAWSLFWRDQVATSPACRTSHRSAGKRLELLREVIPGLRRLAIMANVAIHRRAGDRRGSGGGEHARPRGRHLEIGRAEDIAPAFAALKGAGGTLCLGDALITPTGLGSAPWRWTRGCQRCRIPRVGRSGRSDILWNKLPGPVPARR